MQYRKFKIRNLTKTPPIFNLLAEQVHIIFKKKKAGLALNRNVRKTHTSILTQKPRKASWKFHWSVASTIYFHLQHPTAQECLTEAKWKADLKAQRLKIQTNYSVITTESLHNRLFSFSIVWYRLITHLSTWQETKKSWVWSYLHVQQILG